MDLFQVWQHSLEKCHFSVAGTGQERSNPRLAKPRFDNFKFFERNVILLFPITIVFSTWLGKHFPTGACFIEGHIYFIITILIANPKNSHNGMKTYYIK